jgi:hypothetical protein
LNGAWSNRLSTAAIGVRGARGGTISQIRCHSQADKLLLFHNRIARHIQYRRLALLPRRANFSYLFGKNAQLPLGNIPGNLAPNTDACIQARCRCGDDANFGGLS